VNAAHGGKKDGSAPQALVVHARQQRNGAPHRLAANECREILQPAFSPYDRNRMLAKCGKIRNQLIEATNVRFHTRAPAVPHVVNAYPNDACASKGTQEETRIISKV
jgi:hypothetical protein